MEAARRSARMAKLVEMAQQFTTLVMVWLRAETADAAEMAILEMMQPTMATVETEAMEAAEAAEAETPITKAAVSIIMPVGVVPMGQVDTAVTVRRDASLFIIEEVKHDEI